jgi:hypothetical protein
MNYVRDISFAVKPRFFVFVGGPEKERRMWENDSCGVGPQKLVDGLRKTIHLGMIDWYFTEEWCLLGCYAVWLL